MQQFEAVDDAPGHRVRRAGDGQRDERLVGVQTAVRAVEVLRLETADRFDGRVVDDGQLQVDARLLHDGTESFDLLLAVAGALEVHAG